MKVSLRCALVICLLAIACRSQSSRYDPLPSEAFSVFDGPADRMEDVPDTAAPAKPRLWQGRMERQVKVAEYGKFGSPGSYDRLTAVYTLADTLGLDTAGMPAVNLLTASLEVMGRSRQQDEPLVYFYVNYDTLSQVQPGVYSNRGSYFVSQSFPLSAVLRRQSFPTGLADALVLQTSGEAIATGPGTLRVERLVLASGQGLYELRLRFLGPDGSVRKRLTFRRRG